jgi:hypothetical protein
VTLSPGATVRAALLPWALACAVLVPFLGKPFTIDDPVFLLEARHALEDPLHPTAFEMTLWDVPERVSAMVPPGPVIAWLLVPTMLAGASEHVAHATQLVMVLVAILATVSLALRLGSQPRSATAAGLLLAATPTLLGMAGTAMPDVPAMALGVAGIERFVAWRQDGKWIQGTAASILLALAAMTRLHALLLLPIPVLLIVDDPFSIEAWRRELARAWPALAGAIVIAGSLALATRDPYPGGGGSIGAVGDLSSAENVGRNALSLAIHWVLAVPFALPWLTLSLRSMRAWVVVVASLGAVGLLVAAPGDPPYWLAPIAGVGVAALVDTVRQAAGRRDRIEIALAAWMLIPLPTVVYAHLPPKYLLASAPAAALLVARRAAGRRIGAVATACVAALGVALGVAILRADAALAEVARTGVRMLTAPQVTGGRAVWYDGYWAFQWYAEAAGARRWTARPPQPAPGDLVISHVRRPLPLDSDAFRGLVHLRRYEVRGSGGRVLDLDSNAGFFTNAWGHLPWAWGDGVVDAVDLWLAPPARTNPTPATGDGAGPR